MKIDFSSLRREYIASPLNRKNLNPLPENLLTSWLEDAIKQGIEDANAMGLSSVNKLGRPSSRIVLLKDITKGCLSFFTSYDSRKAVELIENPFAALNFYWSALNRQVRIEGNISRLSNELNDKYFNERPKGSQISTLLGKQSSVVESRETLEKQYKKLELDFKDKSVTRPSNWGGFMLIPYYFEFWQGRPNRLHDRFAYSKKDKEWIIKRLSP